MCTVLESYIHIVKKKSNRNKKKRNKIASNRKRTHLDCLKKSLGPPTGPRDLSGRVMLIFFFFKK